MNVLKIGALDETDTRRHAVIRRGRRLRAKVLPLELFADPAKGIRPHGAVVQAGVAVAAEQVMPGIDIFHSGAMKLRDEAQPDWELMRPVVILHLWFHSCNNCFVWHVATVVWKNLCHDINRNVIYLTFYNENVENV